MNADPAQNESHAGIAGQHTRASILEHARDLVCEVVREAPDGPLKGKLASAAEILHLTLWRVLRYRNNKVRIIEAHEYQNILELSQENRLAVLKRRGAELDHRFKELAAADRHMAALAPPTVRDSALQAAEAAPGKNGPGCGDDVCLGAGWSS
jgi:hypothetical protein